MLCIKTKVNKSKIAGLGLFTDQFIRTGEIVWKFEPKLDRLYSKKDIEKFSQAAKDQFMNYAFLDLHHKRYMLCGDDARFFNHSDTPNCDDSQPDITYAIRDILRGEELTVDYKSFYANINDYPEISLNRFTK